MYRHRQVVRVALYDPSSRDDPRFLVLYKKPNGRHNGYLEFPGGGVEAGERSLEAITRECREELGLKPRSIDHHPITSGAVRLVEKDETQLWELYFGVAPEIGSIRLSSEFSHAEPLSVPKIVERMDRYADLQIQARALDAWVRSEFPRYRIR